MGELTSNNGYLLKAIESLQREIASGKYSNIGEAQMWLDMADCFYHLNELDKSLNAYDESLNLQQSELTKVFKSRALLKLGKVDESKEILNEVNVEELTYSNFFDYVISKCYLAISTKSSTDIDEGLKLITNIKTNDPMFKDTVQGFVIQLYELKNTRKGEKKAESALLRLNRYISLKPSFFGFGIDINAIIDDIGNKSSNKRI